MDKKLMDKCLLTDTELEDKLELIFVADIGYNGRHLTKHKTQYGKLTEAQTCYEPTPIEYARELAYAQLLKATKCIAQEIKDWCK